MKFTTVLSLSVGASAHGIIRSIEGANGVTMPGLGGKCYFKLQS